MRMTWEPEEQILYNWEYKENSTSQWVGGAATVPGQDPHTQHCSVSDITAIKFPPEKHSVGDSDWAPQLGDVGHA